jgi:nucleoside-diphosphate-sugar epimerase
LAGIVSFSLQDKKLLYKVNIDGTKNVLQSCFENNVKNVLHISSVAAIGYNDDANNPVDEHFQFDWAGAEGRKKYYMLSKYKADEIAKEYRQQGLSCTILYPGLMFGPGDMTNSVRLIKALYDGRIPFNMPGGTNIIDVRDVSRGICDTLAKDVQNQDILLSGYNLTFKEVNNLIASQLNTKPPGITLPRFLNTAFFYLALFIESQSRKKLELTADNIDSAFKFRFFNNSRAQKELNWQPEIPFQSTIKDTIDWMNDHDLLER